MEFGDLVVKWRLGRQFLPIGRSRDCKRLSTSSRWLAAVDAGLKNDRVQFSGIKQSTCQRRSDALMTQVVTIVRPGLPDWHGCFFSINSFRLMQVLINGLVSGSSIALLALGFAVVYLPTRVFHVALAGIFSISPFLLWSLNTAGLPWALGVGIAMTTGFAMSVACECFNHARLERKGGGPNLHLVSSLGIFIILVQIIVMIWGNEMHALREGVDAVFSVWGVRITRAQAAAGASSCAVLLMFYFWLQFSNLGLQFRALADNPKQLALMGYNTNRLRVLAFGIAGLFAAVASLGTAFDVGFDAHGGLHALLLAIVAVIVGGREAFLGPVLAGFLIGVLRAEVVWFVSAGWQDAATFVVLILFLFVRPGGLVGKRIRLEAHA